MKATLTFASPALVLLALSITTPAQAQYGGMVNPYLPGVSAGYSPGLAPGSGAGVDPMQQMEQFAPMLEMMKKRMGKKRFGQLMQAVGPMMEQMMTTQGATSGGFGAFGSQNFDPAQMASMITPETIMALVAAFESSPPPRRTTRTQAQRERR